MATPAIDEVVHLFGDDVCCLAYALKDTKVFHQWRHHFAVTGSLNDLSKDGLELTPAARIGGQDVAHPWAVLELGHR
ncbi:unannotated protein [freshwater metagenome]|uniref:Unannotated protein n=1 Tax=freshwater metagenome TaxID=449393 RepID=A0A6J6PYZ6_9ZZZZ